MLRIQRYAVRSYILWDGEIFGGVTADNVLTFWLCDSRVEDRALELIAGS